jgi:hypothetical protein
VVAVAWPLAKAAPGAGSGSRRLDAATPPSFLPVGRGVAVGSAATGRLPCGGGRVTHGAVASAAAGRAACGGGWC